MNVLILVALSTFTATEATKSDYDSNPSVLSTANTRAAFPFSPGFAVQPAAALATLLPSHSWEYGVATEALLELYDPDLSVFGATPFPVPTRTQITALNYAASKIVIRSGANGLSESSGAVGDPASLGVAAVLLGKSNKTFSDAATAETEYLLNGTPRFWNGAISQRSAVPELWADFMYMVPPYLAFFAADSNNETLLQEAVMQCYYYRQVLQANLSSSVPYKGLWEHIIGPESPDTGLWLTGNGWAAAGMTRVLSTVLKASVASTGAWRTQATSNLTNWIYEIVEGAMNGPTDNVLLRNYLDEPNSFGDVSGSSILASVVYRMAVLDSKHFNSTHISWADRIRLAFAEHITTTGIALPAVNPYNWRDTQPYTVGSPEGQNFIVLMYSAWRDCLLAGVCAQDSAKVRRPRSCSNTRRSHLRFQQH